MALLPPQNEVCEGYVFTGKSVHRGVSQHALGRGIYPSMHWAGVCVFHHALGRMGCIPAYTGQGVSAEGVFA